MDMDSSRSRSWGKTAIFVVVATGISYPFRHGLFDWSNNLELVLGLPILQSALEGAGPFVAAAVLTLGFRRDWRPVTFLGTSTIRSMLMMVAPPLAFGLVGIPNESGVSPRLYGLLTGLLVLGYCVLEEVGWRGYLQNVLRPLPETTRFALVGVLWYLWHLSFLPPTTGIGQEGLFLAALILGSLGLGRVAAATRSVCAAAGFHFVINVLFLSGVVQGTFTRRLVLVGICVLFWLPLLWGWKADAEPEEDSELADSATT